MVVSAEQERVKSLIVDTVSLLCKNGLHYSKEFSIEGLLGITLDRDNVFLVNIKEIVKNEAYEGSDSCSDTEAAKSKRRKRKKRQRANSVDSDHSSDEDNHVDNASVISNSQEPPSKRLGNVKQETGAEEEDDDEDLVFIKDEPGVDFSQCSFSQVDTNNAQGNSVLGDLSQQLYNPSHQQQQMQWNNTGPPGASSDQFNNSASSQQGWHNSSSSSFDKNILNLMDNPPPTPSAVTPNTPQQQHQDCTQDLDKLTCRICNKRMQTIPGLVNHMNLHEGRYRYTCEFCGQGFSSSTNYKQHVSSKHTNVPYFKCNMCTEAFQTYKQKKYHMASVHGGGGGGRMYIPTRAAPGGDMQENST